MNHRTVNTLAQSNAADHRFRRASGWLLVFVSLTTGCSFSRFADLEDQAPASRIGAVDRSPSTFGVDLLGVERLAGSAREPGGQLIVSGNDPATLNRLTITAAGDATGAGPGSTQFTDHLGEPKAFTDLARVPQDVVVAAQARDNQFSSGPFIYVAKTGSKRPAVQLIDVTRFEGPTGVTTPDPNLGETFGSGVAAVAMRDGKLADDLAIGAKGAVTLHPTDPAKPWPAQPEEALVLTPANTGQALDATGVYAELLAADLDPSTPEQELIVAAPDVGVVVVIHHLAECLATKDCANYAFRLPVPQGATRFGASLLVANSNGSPELFVGAPGGSGGVTVATFSAANFSTNTPPQVQGIAPPPGAVGFGEALAYGRFGGGEPLLAVGAPSSNVDGTPAAGRVFLYKSDRTLARPDGLALVSAEENALLGHSLATLPFFANNQPLDVLAAGSKQSIFVFFAFVTASHADVRVR